MHGYLVTLPLEWHKLQYAKKVCYTLEEHQPPEDSFVSSFTGRI